MIFNRIDLWSMTRIITTLFIGNDDGKRLCCQPRHTFMWQLFYWKGHSHKYWTFTLQCSRTLKIRNFGCSRQWLFPKFCTLVFSEPPSTFVTVMPTNKENFSADCWGIWRVKAYCLVGLSCAKFGVKMWIQSDTIVNRTLGKNKSCLYI